MKYLVDANVLIFERMREEIEKGATLRMAIRSVLPPSIFTDSVRSRDSPSTTRSRCTPSSMGTFTSGVLPRLVLPWNTATEEGLMVRSER